MQQSAKYKAERTVGNGISQSEHARCGGNTAGSYTVQLDKLPSIKEMTTKVRPTSLPSLLTASPDSYAYELWPIHMQKIKINGQLVKRRVETNG